MACPQSAARSVLVVALAAFPVGANASAANAQETTCLGLRATIIGTGGNDTIHGTDGNDVIVAGDGNDTVYGLAGNDVICGGDGNDALYGGPGADVYGRLRPGGGV